VVELLPTKRKIAMKLCTSALLKPYVRFLMVALIALLLLNAATPHQLWADASSTEPHTEAAVIADDDAWGKAESSGDVAYIDALLLPEYRSIGADGNIHDKAAILTGARRSVNSSTSAAANEKWRAAHPSLTHVQIVGDTAILTFALNKQDTQKPIMSCDVFVYQDGHWHALYSQHTEAGK
jgi:Domain of unknown function (DUF4440)